MRKRREQLRQLDKAALIEAQLLLEQRVRTLEKQVSDLKQLLAGITPRLPKTPENSSIPSGQSRKAKKESKPKAKRGPKAGHVGKSRVRMVPDEIIECRAAACGQCGTNLTGLQQHEVGRHQVIDIPPIRPVVREARRYQVACPNCSKLQTGAYPQGFEKGRVFGSNLERLVIYLHHAHPLGYQRVQHVLKEVCGLTVSGGALVNMVKRNSDKLQTAVKIIQNRVKNAPVIGSDETGARVDGENQWQWVFQTPRWVYTLIHPRRNGAVIQQALDDAQPQVWVSDLASAQLKHPAQQFQVCLAHQVRDLQYALDAHRCAWAERIQALFYRAMRLGKHRNTLPAGVYPQQVAAIEGLLDTCLHSYPNHVDSQRLWRRYHKHRDSLLLFLYRDDVPATNNASEQALRNSVIYRKVSGGFRTAWGAALYANAISILETARRQQLDPLATLASVLAGQPSFSPIGE